MENRGQGKPLIALRRKEKGPRGQPKGSITTDPDEVDEIIRKAYGKIYDGNTKEPEKLRDAYMENKKISYTRVWKQKPNHSPEKISKNQWREQRRQQPALINGHLRI